VRTPLLLQKNAKKWSFQLLLHSTLVLGGAACAQRIKHSSPLLLVLFASSIIYDAGLSSFFLRAGGRHRALFL